MHGFSPPILYDMFVPISRPYNFRQNDTLQRRRINSVRHGTESISFLGPKIWDLVPSDIKLSQSVSIFKSKNLKKWVLLQCSCQLCKIYLQHVGFVQWTPENSLHRNGGVPLSVFFWSIYEQMCVCLLVCSHWFEKVFSGKIASSDWIKRIKSIFPGANLQIC